MRPAPPSVVPPLLAALAVLAFSLGGVAAQAAPGGDPPEAADILPVGFVDEVVLSGLGQMVGFTFGPAGQAYLWQRTGQLYVQPPGAGAPQVMLDLTEEIATWGSHGLLGFALDPDFQVNGHIYLLYVVDHHHLTMFGTPGYDPTADAPFVDTVGRITRYTAAAASGFTTVLPDSRTVLVGESKSTGLPICSGGHSVGSLAFGRDGTLLVSMGDSDSEDSSSGTCLADGILRPAEDVDWFRSQLVDSLAGKILRIDPRTGDGLPGNPWYDPAAPRAARSRVWALGLRNPYRFAVRPGTGSPDPAAADPGALYIGDVGRSSFEELDVAVTGGANFGWPLFEGVDPQPVIAPTPVANLDAPNPLHDVGVQGRGVCAQPFFSFQDLVVQAGDGTRVWPNPCFPAQPITSAPVHVHRPAAVSWAHDGTAWVPVVDGGPVFGVPIDDPASPVVGEPFTGNASIGGAFYTGVVFPFTWRNTLFHADYGAGWIRNFVFDEQHRLVQVREFADPTGRVVHIAENPADGALYYLDLTDTGVSELHRVRYLEGNLPPSAEVSSSATWGEVPLTVAFDATSSTDPEDGELSYTWDLGPGIAPSIAPRPVRTFPSTDVTGAATEILAHVFELVPPGSMGTANDDPEVIRDGVFPPEGSMSYDEMFDTVHVDADLVPDKGGEDWMGYGFPDEHEFVGMLLQLGRQFSVFGGWLDAPTVQVRQDGVWTDVTGLVSSPAYVGPGVENYVRYDLSFDPTSGDGIRIHGTPGGDLEFFTLGELRVLAVPSVPDPTPVNVPVQVVVTDPAGATDTASVVVSAGNTPPTATILAPADFGTYSTDVPQLVTLEGAAADAEDEAAALSCAWQVILHHDDHNHPGPIVSGCVQQQLLSTDGCPDVHYQEVRFLVSDSLGLMSEASRYLVADCDRDLSGTADAIEIAARPGKDLDGDGVPDVAQVDCNGNLVPDLYEVFFGLVEDADGDGRPDDCPPVLPEGPGGGPFPGASTPPGGAGVAPGGPGGGTVPPVDADGLLAPGGG